MDITIGSTRTMGLGTLAIAAIDRRGRLWLGTYTRGFSQDGYYWRIIKIVFVRPYRDDAMQTRVCVFPCVMK